MRHHKHHGIRRRHNPFIEKDQIALVGWGVVGAITVPTLNSKLLPSMNAGVTGYAVKAALSFGLKYAGAMISRNAENGLFVGGLIATGMAIVKDTLGAQLGLSAYWPSSYPLPTNSNPWGITNRPALPAVVASAAGNPGAVASRSGMGRFVRQGRAR